MLKFYFLMSSVFYFNEITDVEYSDDQSTYPISVILFSTTTGSDSATLTLVYILDLYSLFKDRPLFFHTD